MKNLIELQQMPVIDLLGQKLHLEVSHYITNEDRIAVVFWTAKGEPYGALTVNIPEEKLNEGEFFVRNNPDDEELIWAAIHSRQFIDTGRRVQAGYTEAQVWRFRNSMDSDETIEKGILNWETRRRLDMQRRDK